VDWPQRVSGKLYNGDGEQAEAAFSVGMTPAEVT